jgi:hypothetical protein
MVKGCLGSRVPSLDGCADSGDDNVESDLGFDMKLRISAMGLVLSGGVALLGASAAAQTETTPVIPPPQPAVTARPAATVTLPYGVDDVLKLSRAQVSEDIIVNYIQNSGIAYNLRSQELVYLKEQGVSDRVVNAMLDERKRVIAEAAAAAQAAPPPAPAPAQTSETISTASYAPTFSEPQNEVQPAPSTVYVIPSQPTYSYYSAPYYGSWGGPYYYGPSLAIGFAFGGHSSSCWHGGWHGSSSWHGGGGWHGGHH